MATPTCTGMLVQLIALIFALLRIIEGTDSLTPCGKFLFKPATKCSTNLNVNGTAVVEKRTQCAAKCAGDPNCWSVKISPFGDLFECFTYNQLFPNEGCDPSTEYFNMIGCKNGGILRKDGMNCTCFGGYIGHSCEEIMKDCTSGFESGMYNQSGVYLVKPDTSPAPFKVYCRRSSKNMYTVIQKNTGAENFNRSWDEYAQGFGDIALDHWLGNTKISQLTNQETADTLTVTFLAGGYTRKSYYFRFDVANESNYFSFSYAWYETEPEVDNQLGQCLTVLQKPFNTYDFDPDGNGNCGAIRGGGWWYPNCGKCTPNARVTGNAYSGFADVNWQNLDKTLPITLVMLTLS